MDERKVRAAEGILKAETEWHENALSARIGLFSLYVCVCLVGYSDNKLEWPKV